MKKNHSHLDPYRLRSGPYASPPGAGYGAFQIGKLRVISSGSYSEQGDGLAGYEHVSVSLGNRCPTWAEMCKVKQLFWGDDECVVQFHPKKSDYINNHPHCLHMWKPVQFDIPMPERLCV